MFRIAPTDDVTIDMFFPTNCASTLYMSFLFATPLSYVIFSINSHQALVEKDWLAFGHPFSDRVGMPNISGSGNFDLPRQSSSAGSFPSSPVRQSSGSAASQSSNSSHGHNNYSPIFMQVRE